MLNVTSRNYCYRYYCGGFQTRGDVSQCTDQSCDDDFHSFECLKFAYLHISPPPLYLAKIRRQITMRLRNQSGKNYDQGIAFSQERNVGAYYFLTTVPPNIGLSTIKRCITGQSNQTLSGHHKRVDIASGVMFSR